MFCCEDKHQSHLRLHVVIPRVNRSIVSKIWSRLVFLNYEGGWKMNNAEQIIESSGVLVETMKKYLYILDAQIERLEAVIGGIQQVVLEEGHSSVLPSGTTINWTERLGSTEKELKIMKELRDTIANS